MPESALLAAMPACNATACALYPAMDTYPMPTSATGVATGVGHAAGSDALAKHEGRRPAVGAGFEPAGGQANDGENGRDRAACERAFAAR